MRASLEYLFQKYSVFVLFPRLFLVDFLPILYNSLMNIISLFESRSTFGALWEGNIPFEIGHIRDMEVNVSNGLFALSLWSF